MKILQGVQSAAVASTAPAIDPTLLAVLSIFGGAFLTVVAGFVGAGVQARREHGKWLREQRLDAYIGFLRVIHNMQVNLVRIEQAQRDREVMDTTAEHLRSGLDIFSDEELRAATRELKRQMKEHAATYSELDEERRAITARMTDHFAAFVLLGPSEVSRAAQALPDATQQGASQALIEATWGIKEAMRRALNITW